MFERLSRSWELVKASAEVLHTDNDLLLFPVVSGVLLVDAKGLTGEPGCPTPISAAACCEP
jgi:hypothetical protein